MLTPLLTNQLTYLLTCLEVARRLAARMEDASERDQAGRGRVAMDAVHGDRVVAAVGGEHEVAARVDRHAAAPVPNINWLSLRPAGSPEAPLSVSSCLRLPHAPASLGKPRPATAGLLSCAGRSCRPVAFHTGVAPRERPARARACATPLTRPSPPARSRSAAPRAAIRAPRRSATLRSGHVGG